ncbi:hypothetical protein FB451DRAFT_1058496, partial [Mycena latifolia]
IPESACPFFRKFSLQAAEKTTPSGPSTNRPIRCILCHTSQPQPGRHPIRRREHVFWLYNLPAHIKLAHPNAMVPAEFSRSYMITEDELVHFKLKKGKVAPKKATKRKAADTEKGGSAAMRQHIS